DQLSSAASSALRMSDARTRAATASGSSWGPPSPAPENASSVVGPGDTQGLTPAPHHAFADAPPVPDGGGRFVADGTGQLLVQQQPGATAPGADGPAAWPGDAGVAPAGDDHVTIPQQAGCPVTTAQGWRLVGAVQQAEAGVQGASHGRVSLSVVSTLAG